MLLSVFSSLNPRLSDYVFMFFFSAGIQTFYYAFLFQIFSYIIYFTTLFMKNKLFGEKKLDLKKLISEMIISVAIFIFLPIIQIFLAVFAILISIFNLNYIWKSLPQLNLDKNKFHFLRLMVFLTWLTCLFIDFLFFPLGGAYILIFMKYLVGAVVLIATIGGIIIGIIGNKQNKITYLSDVIVNFKLRKESNKSNIDNHNNNNRSERTEYVFKSVKSAKFIKILLISISILSVSVFINSGFLKIHSPAPDAPTSSELTELKIITYNIRNPNSNDGLDSWSNRKVYFCDYLETLDYDIIGLQEATLLQIDFIMENVNNRNYKWTGFGRDDGVHGGEHTPILFDADKYVYIDGDTFWFNINPNIPGNGYQDTYNCKRVTTWARLEVKSTGAQFMVFCTHYGFGDIFRGLAGKLLIEKVEEYSGGLPVIVMGDFNLDSTSFGYDYVYKNGTKQLIDTYSLANGLGPHLIGTFNSFDVDSTITRKIDFVFVSNEISVSSSEVLKDTYEHGGVLHVYSDHYPVVSTISF